MQGADSYSIDQEGMSDNCLQARLTRCTAEPPRATTAHETENTQLCDHDYQSRRNWAGGGYTV